MTTYKNREMATGPFPVSVTTRTVRVETTWSGGSYNTHAVGDHIVIHLSDGSEVACCDRPHGHKRREVLIRCATAKVAKLNDAAGIPEEVR